MKKLGPLLAILPVAIGVALTYYFFENVVHQSIDLIWYDWLNTDVRRWLIVPACLIIGLLFFGLQHYLDPRSETKEEAGLGSLPNLRITSYLKILFIGYFSLVAGASLGPEAVLVPACMLLGALIGSKLFKNNSAAVKLLTAAGFIALFTAFFHSFIVGLLSVALVTKEAKTKLTPPMFIAAAIASASSFFTLKLIEAEPYATLPPYSWHINPVTVLLMVVLAAAGFIAVYGMSRIHDVFDITKQVLANHPWWIHGSVAALGLSLLYFSGGPLVEFTGNKSIVPMFGQVAELGLIGLLWILIVKVIAIGWSKSLGYRGGMIFPTIFVASVLVAIAQLYVKDFNLIYGLIAVMIGAFVANGKTKILV